MEIQLNNLRTIGELQYDFNREFPFLRLEFIEPQRSGKTGARPKAVPGHWKLGTIKKIQAEKKITVAKTQTVRGLENELEKDLGVSVQVLRRSGNSWIETTLTDLWTLEQQNREGSEMSNNPSNRINM